MLAAFLYLLKASGFLHVARFAGLLLGLGRLIGGGRA